MTRAAPTSDPKTTQTPDIPAVGDPAAYRLPPERVESTISPALVVYLEHVRHNIDRVLAALGGDAARWRPHVKTVKMPVVFTELIRRGVRHFKCATTREAEHLLRTLEQLDAGDASVLLAHPLVGPGLSRLATLAAARPGVEVSVLSEDPVAVASIPDVLGVFADIDSGMRRTGIAPEDVDAIAALARHAGPRFRGVHFYDGHLSGPDRHREAHEGYDRLASIVRALREEHRIDVPEMVTSGTPSFRAALVHRPLAETGIPHRVSPGTVVFHDTRSASLEPTLGLRPAAVVLTRVVSRPGPDRVTCDAGSKSIAAEAGDPCAAVIGHPHLQALRPTEEHLPLRVGDGPRPHRGDVLLLVPRHVCPTVNLAEQAVVVDGGMTRLEPVSARAHDL